MNSIEVGVNTSSYKQFIFWVKIGKYITGDCAEKIVYELSFLCLLPMFYF